MNISVKSNDPVDVELVKRGPERLICPAVVGSDNNTGSLSYCSINLPANICNGWWVKSGGQYYEEHDTGKLLNKLNKYPETSIKDKELIEKFWSY